MGDDLISRKAVMDRLRKWPENINIEKNKREWVYGNVYYCANSMINTFMNFVAQMPTAYDKDKVVERLEAERKEAEEYNQSSAMIAHEIDIEIVKSGGIE